MEMVYGSHIKICSCTRLILYLVRPVAQDKKLYVCQKFQNHWIYFFAFKNTLSIYHNLIAFTKHKGQTIKQVIFTIEMTNGEDEKMITSTTDSPDGDGLLATLAKTPPKESRTQEENSEQVSVTSRLQFDIKWITEYIWVKERCFNWIF